MADKSRDINSKKTSWKYPRGLFIMRKENNQMLDFFTDLYYYKKAYLIGEDCLGYAVQP